MIDSIHSIFGLVFWFDVQYIPRNMHTVFALLCFVVIIHLLIFHYPSGLLHWHCGNLTIAPVPAKQPWWIWINTSCESIMKYCITTTKQSTTKPCAYFLGYTVPHAALGIYFYSCPFLSYKNLFHSILFITTTFFYSTAVILPLSPHLLLMYCFHMAYFWSFTSKENLSTGNAALCVSLHITFWGTYFCSKFDLTFSKCHQEPCVILHYTHFSRHTETINSNLAWHNYFLPFAAIYSISQEICTRFCCALLCCGYAIVHNEFTWSIYPYSSGLLCWHWGNR